MAHGDQHITHNHLSHRSNLNNRRLRFAGDVYSYSPDTVTIAHAGPVVGVTPTASLSTTRPPRADIDCLAGRFYWTDVRSSSIRSSNYDGTQRQPTVSKASIEDGKQRTVIKEGLINPRGIATHPGYGLLFWSDWNRLSPKIESSGLDGSNRQVMVNEDILLPNSLVVDYETETLCWADAGTHKIVDRYSGIESPARAPPPGGSGKLYGISAVPPSCPSVSNVCAVDDGGCRSTHLCLPNNRGGRTCACTDLALQDEGSQQRVFPRPSVLTGSVSGPRARSRRSVSHCELYHQTNTSVSIHLIATAYREGLVAPGIHGGSGGMA
ncbi:Nidogen-1 [Chionoecetes opilio]|uniref:Nidogen-1 n=1 Tax=Chionoecetes opilio TaxID=41210 RepID=A0A8J5CAL9_CHIOP|nr:Nidogen-1 [Chionoecetes opilio]